jgi:Ca2+-binding EF-hand superfamily protein
LDQIYRLLDGNGDGVLTTKEIRDGFKKLDLDLTSRDIEEIIKVLDKNTDGMISLEEFVQNL